MFEKLVEKVDEMFGASLLTGIAVYAMYLNIAAGVVEMCITGVIALLVTKAVRSTAT